MGYTEYIIFNTSLKEIPQFCSETICEDPIQVYTPNT